MKYIFHRQSNFEIGTQSSPALQDISLNIARQVAERFFMEAVTYTQTREKQEAQNIGFDSAEDLCSTFNNLVVTDFAKTIHNNISSIIESKWRAVAQKKSFAKQLENSFDLLQQTITEYGANGDIAARIADAINNNLRYSIPSKIRGQGRNAIQKYKTLMNKEIEKYSTMAITHFLAENQEIVKNCGERIFSSYKVNIDDCGSKTQSYSNNAIIGVGKQTHNGLSRSISIDVRSSKIKNGKHPIMEIGMQNNQPRLVDLIQSNLFWLHDGDALEDVLNNVYNLLYQEVNWNHTTAQMTEYYQYFAEMLNSLSYLWMAQGLQKVVGLQNIPSSDIYTTQNFSACFFIFGHKIYRLSDLIISFYNIMQSSTKVFNESGIRASFIGRDELPGEYSYTLLNRYYRRIQRGSGKGREYELGNPETYHPDIKAKGEELYRWYEDNIRLDLRFRMFADLLAGNLITSV